MLATNFMTCFALSVLRWLKRTTIRPSTRFKVKGRYVGFFGMRTNCCVRLVEGTGMQTDPISINADGIHAAGALGLLPDSRMRALAAGDGFRKVPEFLKFLAETYPLPRGIAGALAQAAARGKRAVT